MTQLPTFERILSEINAQDGDDLDAPELAESEWAKIKTNGMADYGSPVAIVFCGDMKGIVDHGYLTTIPGKSGEWEEIGIVHVPAPWVEKTAPIPEWHSLYSLCRNPLVREIKIGLCPRYA